MSDLTPETLIPLAIPKGFMWKLSDSLTLFCIYGNIYDIFEYQTDVCVCACMCIEPNTWLISAISIIVDKGVYNQNSKI